MVKPKAQILFDNVLVKPFDDSEETTKSRFVTRKTASDAAQLEGTIYAVGDGVETVVDGIRTTFPLPDAVAVGARCVIGKFSGRDVTIDEVQYKLISVRDILAILD